MGDCTQLIKFLTVQKEILVPKARQLGSRGEKHDESIQEADKCAAL